MSSIQDALLAKSDELFAIFDKNKTGKLDFGEFKEALTKIYKDQGKPEPKFLEFNDILNKYDTNKDKMLDKEEFKKMITELGGLQ